LNKASDKIKEAHIGDELQKVGSKVTEGAKNIASKVGQTVTDPNLGTNVKEFGSKVATGAKNTANVVADKTKEIWVYF
jgi:hypothetical protein